MGCLSLTDDTFLMCKHTFFFFFIYKLFFSQLTLFNILPSAFVFYAFGLPGGGQGAFCLQSGSFVSRFFDGCFTLVFHF